MSKNILVAYFSASGVTAKVAEELAKAEGADLLEIKPEVPYTAADLDWTNKQSRSTIEMSDPDCRPAIAASDCDVSQYDVVFVGFPVWWGREPSVVDTFLDAYDFTGKKIIPFCTSGGSGAGRTGETLGEQAGTGTFLTSTRLDAGISEAELQAWINR